MNVKLLNNGIQRMGVNSVRLNNENLDKMTELQKEFEATGYTSWINADLYPDGKIYTQEYTQWLEKRVEALSLHSVGNSLPERNSGEMWSFLLVNALRCLNEEQRAGLCFDLYSRNELTKSIDERICKLKEERQ